MSEPTTPSTSGAPSPSQPAAPEPSRRQTLRRQATARRSALVHGLPRRTRWLADDTTRALVALIGFAIAIIVTNMMGRSDSEIDRVIESMATLGGFLSVYAVLTLVAFAGLEGQQLGRALGIAKQRAIIRRESSSVPGLYPKPRPHSVGGDGASWPVVLALVAFVVVLGLVANSSLRSNTGGVVTAVVLVVGAWGGTLIAYSLHMARRDFQESGLSFPAVAGAEDRGTADRVFGDYLFLGLTIQVSFGPGDVAITTARMRRTIAGHMMISYLFNTLVVAMLVSLLVSVSV